MATSKLTPITGIQLNSKSIVLMQCDEFIVTTRAELKARGILIRNSGREVKICNAVYPVFEKRNWDYCIPIARMFNEADAVYKLESVLVKEIVVCDHNGIHIERPKWRNTW